MDFNVIWRYFGWLNQVLACITLWALSVLMKRRGRFHWVVSLPALFLTNVCLCFMLISPEFCINVPLFIANIISLVVTSALYAFFLWKDSPHAEIQRN
jgi:carbon starvation protein CstA